jgi:hypothetical protein
MTLFARLIVFGLEMPGLGRNMNSFGPRVPAGVGPFMSSVPIPSPLRTSRWIDGKPF